MGSRLGLQGRGFGAERILCWFERLMVLGVKLSGFKASDLTNPKRDPSPRSLNPRPLTAKPEV